MTKHYSKTTGGFYPTDMRADYVTAGSWPADAVEVTDAKYAALMNGQAAGGNITADATGMPVLQIQAAPTKVELAAYALAATRIQRQPIMGILDGLQASANTKADTVRATAIETAKQGLRDITKLDLTLYTTADAMKVAVMTQYKALAAALPVDVRTAFAGSVS